jgi:hypothetical protein
LVIQFPSEVIMHKHFLVCSGVKPPDGDACPRNAHAPPSQQANKIPGEKLTAANNVRLKRTVLLDGKKERAARVKTRSV